MKVNLRDFESMLRAIIQPLLSGHLCAIRQELEAIFAACPGWVPWIEHQGLLYLLGRLLESDLPRLEYEANELILLYPDTSATIASFIKKIKEYTAQVSKALKNFQAVECPNLLADLLAKDRTLWIEHETQSQIAANAEGKSAARDGETLANAAAELEANRREIDKAYGSLEGLEDLVSNYKVFITDTINELPEETFAPDLKRKQVEYGAAIRAVRGIINLAKVDQVNKKKRQKVRGGRR